MKIIDNFINLLKLKRYSENTIETYKNVLVQTYIFFKKPFKDITDKDLWVFISRFVNEKNISSYYQRQMLATNLLPPKYKPKMWQFTLLKRGY